MRKLIGVLFLASLGLPAFADNQNCAGFADDRLDGLMRNIALLAEQVDAGLYGQTPVLAAQTSRLRELIADADSDAMDVACEMLNRYPSLEDGLANATRDLDRPDIKDWLRSVNAFSSGRGSELNCLNALQYSRVRNTLFFLEVTDYVQQTVCDSLSCAPGACRICAITGAVAGAVRPPFEAALAVDGLYCSTQHAEDMTAYCEFPNGHCANTRGTGSTLVDLEAEVSGPLVTTLRGLSADVATGANLQSTRELIDDRIDRTLEQIDAATRGLSADAQRRARFQTDLRVLEIERALAIGSGSVPVQLQLPAFAGGSLEEVREVVADAIVASLEAGLEINQARVLHRSGDVHLNNGEYGPAFLAYRDAYRELVQ